MVRLAHNSALQFRAGLVNYAYFPDYQVNSGHLTIEAISHLVPGNKERRQLEVVRGSYGSYWPKQDRKRFFRVRRSNGTKWNMTRFSGNKKSWKSREATDSGFPKEKRLAGFHQPASHLNPCLSPQSHPFGAEAGKFLKREETSHRQDEGSNTKIQPVKGTAVQRLTKAWR